MISVPLAVLSTDPLDGNTKASVVDPVTATFNQPLQASSVTDSTFTLKQGSTSVTGTVTLSGDDKTAVFQQDSDLDPSKTYTATIKGGSNGVKDLAGNLLASDKVWSFTTTPPDMFPPKVLSTSLLIWNQAFQ